MDLSAGTVAERLCDRSTRAVALDALERHTAPIPTAVALAAARAAAELKAMEAEEADRAEHDRAGLLLARLLDEAAPNIVAIFGAAFGDGRLERVWNANNVLNAALLRKPAAQLTRADAVSHACSEAWHPPSYVRASTAPWAGAGLTCTDFMGLYMGCTWFSKKKTPEDDVPMKMMALLLELLKSSELPELAIGGAWVAARNCVTGRPSVASAAVEGGVFELAVAHLNAIGSPADWVTISRGKAGRAYIALGVITDINRVGNGQASRPDLGACVASGLFDMCVEAVAAIAAAGVDGLRDTNHNGLCQTLSVIRDTRAQPGCEAKIRNMASALAFCLANDLNCIQEMGVATANTAAQICKTQAAQVLRC